MIEVITSSHGCWYEFTYSKKSKLHQNKMQVCLAIDSLEISNEKAKLFN